MPTQTTQSVQSVQTTQALQSAQSVQTTQSAQATQAVQSLQSVESVQTAEPNSVPFKQQTASESRRLFASSVPTAPIDWARLLPIRVASRHNRSHNRVKENHP